MQLLLIATHSIDHKMTQHDSNMPALVVDLTP